MILKCYPQISEDGILLEYNHNTCDNNESLLYIFILWVDLWGKYNNIVLSVTAAQSGGILLLGLVGHPGIERYACRMLLVAIDL